MSAVEAIKDAMTGENERLKQYGIRTSTNSKKGTVDYYWIDKNGKQKQFRANLLDQKQLVETISMIMKDKFGGATDDLAKGWSGIMSSISSMKDKFELMTMNGGAFEKIKLQLKGFLDQLSIWEKDGTMKAFADTFGNNLTEVLNALIPAAKGAWDGIKQLARVVQRLSEIAGGYENLGLFAFGIYLLSKSMGLVIAVKSVVGILGSVAALGTGGAAGGLLKVAGGIGAIAAALALVEQYTPNMLAYLDGIDPVGPTNRDRQGTDKKKYQHDNPFAANWAPVGQELVDRGVEVAGNYIKQQYASLDSGFQAWTASIRAKVATFGSELMAVVKSGLGSLFDVGSEWMASLWQGMMSQVTQMVAWASGIGSQIRAALGSIVGGGPVAGASSRADAFRSVRVKAAPVAAVTAGGPRALGGSVYSGGTHLVSEYGPELMTAKRYGHVTPNHKLKSGGDTHISLGGIVINGDANERTLSKLADMLSARLRSSLHDGAYA